MREVGVGGAGEGGGVGKRSEGEVARESGGWERGGEVEMNMEVVVVVKKWRRPWRWWLR